MAECDNCGANRANFTLEECEDCETRYCEDCVDNFSECMDVGGICAMNTVNFGATKNTVTIATSSPMVMKTKAPSDAYTT